MSEFTTRKITDRAGTGAPSFTYGLNIAGSDSGLIGKAITSSGTQPSSPANGDLWYDSTNDKLYYYVAGEFKQITHVNAVSGIAWGGTRGITAAGDTNLSNSHTNVINYFDYTTAGNSTDFGDLTRSRMFASAVSNASRVVFGVGGNTGNLLGYDDTLDYITVATTGNATDFGNRTVTYGGGAVTSDGTYGLFAGGEGANSGGAPYSTNVIDYITIASTGNATDFGDLTASKEYMGNGVISNGTLGYFFEDNDFANYVTIATTGNATSTSLSTNASGDMGCASDDSRGLIQGGATIEYFSIATSVSASDFGDTIQTASYTAGASDGTYASFSGGYQFTGGSNYLYDNIQLVTVQTAGNATQHGNLSSNVWKLGASSGAAS
jgi:hypothetical protein